MDNNKNKRSAPENLSQKRSKLEESEKADTSPKNRSPTHKEYTLTEQARQHQLSDPTQQFLARIQTMNPVFGLGRGFDQSLSSNEAQSEVSSSASDIHQQQVQDARFSNPFYLSMLGINDAATSKNNEVSSKSLENRGENSQYQYFHTTAEKRSEEAIDTLQKLEKEHSSNNIKAVIAKLRFTIYEKRDELVAPSDIDQHSTRQPEAWKALQQLSEFTETKGKSFIDCLNNHKDYQNDYETYKHLTENKIEEFKKQQDLAKDKQKQRIENFITIIEQEFQKIKQDPIDAKFDLRLPIEEITEKYQKMIFEASEEINEFNTLITDSSDKVTNYLESYQDYQNDYETHKHLATAKIEELKLWQNHMKKEHKQKIEKFIITIEDEFRAIKQSPIETEVNITIPIDQAAKEYNEQLIKAFDELSEFSTLVTDSSNEFIDELKLTQIKELPMNILKSEIQRLKPQASPWGDSTAQELHNFIPSLQLIEEYGDNHFDTRYNKQILEICNNISKKYLNEKTPSEKLGFPATKNAHNIIKDTLRKIGFPHDIPTNTPKSKEKEKVGLEQQLEKDHKVYILDKLKSLQDRGTIKIMSEGALGLHRLWYQQEGNVNNHLQKPLISQCKNLEILIKTLRNQIISHDSTKNWPDDTINSIKDIQSELDKLPRQPTNKLIKDLHDQIKDFSNEFKEERRQQK